MRFVDVISKQRAACKRLLRRLTKGQAGSNLVVRWKGEKGVQHEKQQIRRTIKFIPRWLSGMVYLWHAFWKAASICPRTVLSLGMDIEKAGRGTLGENW